MARIDVPRRSDLPKEYQYLLGEDALGELELLQAIGSNPPVLQTYMRHGTALWKHAGLSPQELEVTILAVARELENEYEWHQHIGLARDAGVSGVEIREIGRGQFDGDSFDASTEALIDYARAAARRAVDDDAHEAISSHFDQEAVAGIATVVGHYLATAVVIDALDVRPETPFVGWVPDDETIERYDRKDN